METFKKDRWMRQILEKLQHVLFFPFFLLGEHPELLHRSHLDVVRS